MPVQRIESVIVIENLTEIIWRKRERLTKIIAD